MTPLAALKNPSWFPMRHAQLLEPLKVRIATASSSANTPGAARCLSSNSSLISVALSWMRLEVMASLSSSGLAKFSLQNDSNPSLILRSLSFMSRFFDLSPSIPRWLFSPQATPDATVPRAISCNRSILSGWRHRCNDDLDTPYFRRRDKAEGAFGPLSSDRIWSFSCAVNSFRSFFVFFSAFCSSIKMSAAVWMALMVFPSMQASRMTSTFLATV
mmetsp:Transcript_17127/g.30767  ORF Transcript_17127/g.30767 Transcript_17127/m.30767 type:complete len:216 (+) Transcript_17127:483-1130(+)